MSDCIFCQISKTPEKFLLESEYAYAIPDIKPVTPGHTLVITKQHFENLQATKEEILQNSILLVKKVADLLLEKYPSIKGFNYVSNQGKNAKQVIFHFHMHIIPRY